MLTSDLVVPNENTTAISITADGGVTLDLAGFGVRGPVTCSGGLRNTACSASGSGIGIFIDPSSPATALIRNGFVRGMGNVGILANGALGAVIEHVVVEENASHGIDLHGGSVVDSVARYNGANGIHYCDCGGSARNQIERNVVGLNRAVGIRSGNGTIRDNYIFVNGAEGIAVASAGSNSISIVGNTIEQNAGNGINASAGAYRDNMIRSNLQTVGHQVVGSVTDGGGNVCSPAC